MELRQLRYFVAVVEHESFTAAAAALAVSQPGVSAQIRRLETSVGHTLLDRSGPGISTTAAGETFLPFARQALAALDRGRESLDSLAGLEKGRVTLGIVANLSEAAVDLPLLLGDFHSRHPSIDVKVVEANADRLVDDVRGGPLDVALVALGDKPPSDLEVHVVVREWVVAAASPTVWAEMPSRVTPEMLRGRELLILPRGSGIRSRLEQWLAAESRATHVGVEASDPAMLARLAHEGMGVALVPRSYAGALPSAPLAPSLTGLIALVWNGPATSSPACRAFVSMAMATWQTEPL